MDKPTPIKCYCGADRLYVYEGRIAFTCGTVALLPQHTPKWRVKRSLQCVLRHAQQEQRPFYYETPKPIPSEPILCGNYRDYQTQYIGCTLSKGHEGHCTGAPLNKLPTETWVKKWPELARD